MKGDLFEPITRVAGESADASAPGMERDHATPAGCRPVEAATLTANPRPDLAGSAADKPHPVGAAALSASRARALGQNCGNCGNGTASSIQGFYRCALQPVWRAFSPCFPCPIGAWEPQSADKAKRAAQDGIDRAVAAADRSIAGWSDFAFDFIKLWASANSGKRAIGHDIVQASIAAGIAQPPNPKAWGGPIQRAARIGVIRKVGTAPDPNRHTNPVPLWEAA
jgi:hypothetical protein